MTLNEKLNFELKRAVEVYCCFIKIAIFFEKKTNKLI
jgi:hypothetical protein